MPLSRDPENPRIQFIWAKVSHWFPPPWPQAKIPAIPFIVFARESILGLAIVHSLSVIFLFFLFLLAFCLRSFLWSLSFSFHPNAAVYLWENKVYWSLRSGNVLYRSAFIGYLEGAKMQRCKDGLAKELLRLSNLNDSQGEQAVVFCFLWFSILGKFFPFFVGFRTDFSILFEIVFS